MSLICMTLDTKTREIILTIDGVPVVANECSMMKFQDCCDPDVTRSAFWVVQPSVDENGLAKTVEYRLPPEDMSEVTAGEAIDNRGLMSVDKIQQTVVAKSVAEFLLRGVCKQPTMDDHIKAEVEKLAKFSKKTDDKKC